MRLKLDPLGSVKVASKCIILDTEVHVHVCESISIHVV